MKGISNLQELQMQWISIDKKFYEVARLNDFAYQKFLGSSYENDQPGQPTFSTSYYGGPIVRRSNNKITFFTHSGFPVLERIRFEAAAGAKYIHILPDCRIAFLDPEGGIQLYHTNGTFIANIPVDVPSAVTAVSTCPDGMCFASQDKTISFFDNKQCTVTKKYNITVTSDIKFVAAIDIQNELFAFITQDLNVYLKSGASLIMMGTLPSEPKALVTPFGGNIFGVLTESEKTCTIFLYPVDRHQMNPLQVPKNTKALAFVGSSILSFITGRTAMLLSFTGSSSTIKEVSDPIAIVQDLNCVRIISKQGSFLVRAVPDSLSAFSMGQKFVNDLANSYELFLTHHIECYTRLEHLKGSFNTIFKNVLNAAKNAMTLESQQYILKLLVYARTANQCAQGDEYANLIEQLRILNTLNMPAYAMAMTPEMVQEGLQSDYLFDRCLELHYYELAYKICPSKESSIAQSWSLEMISIYGDKCVPTVLKKLERFSKIDYLSIASHAFKSHVNDELAIQFVKRIQDPVKRIQFALQVAPSRAYDLAMESYDGGAIIAFVMAADPSQRKELMEKSAAISDQVIAFKKYEFFEMFQQTRNDKVGRLPQYISSLPITCSQYPLEVSLLSPAPPNQFGNSHEALKYSQNAFNGNKLFTSLIDQQIEINKICSKLIKSSKKPTCSPRQRLSQAILAGDEKLFQSIRKTCNFSNKAIIWIKLRTYVANQKWDELKLLARQPYNDVGWDCFAEVCAEYGYRDRAIDFIRKSSDLNMKLQFCKRWGYDTEYHSILAESGSH